MDIRKRILWVVIVPVIITTGIKISPEADFRNSSVMPGNPTKYLVSTPLDLLVNESTLGTDITTSERTRRLIPYMSFYIPQAQIPINQKYVVQTRPKQRQHQPLPKAQQFQPSPTLHLPSAYVHMKVPAHNAYQQSHPKGNHLSNRHHIEQPAFQTIAYGGQHPLTQMKNPNNFSRKIPPQHFAQPAISQRFSNSFGFKDDYIPKHNSLSQSQQQYVQSQPQHQKFSMTPFTPLNTVPGNFIPVIYTNNDKAIAGKVTQNQLNNHLSQQSALKQYSSKSSGAPSGEILINLPDSSTPRPNVLLQSLPTIQQDDQQLQYITVSPVPHSTTSPSYHIVSTVQSDDRYQQQLNQRILSVPTPQPTTPEQMTPQQKYVLFLQQQLRLKQQQQIQEHEDGRLQLQEQLQHSHHQDLSSKQYEQLHHIQPPPADIVLTVTTTISTTPPSVATPSPAVHSVPNYDNHHNPNRFNEKYPQHSPVNHPVYQTTDPALILSTGKQQHVQPQPSAAAPKYAQSQLESHQYASNPNYIEYFIDDPKQEIEEQGTQQLAIRPPPLNLGSSPVPAPAPVEVVVTSPTPLYDNKPTIRLHALSPAPQTHLNSHQDAQNKPDGDVPLVVVSSKPTYTKPFQKIDSSASLNDEPLPDIKTASLAEILRKLQESNHLPKTLTPDNIDNSIRTLIRILQNLKGSQTIIENPSQYHEEDYEYNTSGGEDGSAAGQQDLGDSIDSTAIPGPNSGRPGIDYPILYEIPETSFDCQEQRYKGFFGDPETNCQVWHYCDLNGGKASFLCPNGTIFSQIALTCDWWFNVKCATTPQLYVLNERLYKYILPFTPKFPEDYSGPLVDKYLALKFKEMEEKMSREKLKGRIDSGESGNSTSEEIVTLKPMGEDELTNTEANIGNSKSNSSVPIGEQSSERNQLIDEETAKKSTYSRELQFYSTTPNTTPNDVPLSLRPIVVSSTPSPFQVPFGEPLVGKISVEKLEMIEIKSDGNSGHLIPNLKKYSPADT